jgi:carboxyl-terminal processing protease
MRSGKQLQFTVTRGAIEVPSVDWHVITGTSSLSPTVGYIGIHQFTERTGSEVKQAIGALRKAGSQAYLIDLRDNGGGLLNAAVDVASLFLDSGTVLIERRHDQPDVTFPVTKDSAGVYQEPLAVLINGNTASAAEIVAGAIQDNQRGKLIGDKSFGKGSVQSIYDLSDGSSIHITSAKWLTPKQRTIDGVGLMPDVVVARAGGEAQRGQDSQLDRALAVLRSVPTH